MITILLDGVEMRFDESQRWKLKIAYSVAEVFNSDYTAKYKLRHILNDLRDGKDYCTDGMKELEKSEPLPF